MKSAKLTFEMTGYWHMGSGFGEGANLDAVVVKTQNGLPYIPGKTVKGLMREAVFTAEECSRVGRGTTTKLFGSHDLNKSRFETTPGSLTFTNATLGTDMEEWAGKSENVEMKQLLFHQVAATKIDESGTAENKSLRRVEVVVPLTLTAYVASAEDDQEWVASLKEAAPLVRHIGSHRHRGLGRAIMKVEEMEG